MTDTTQAVGEIIKTDVRGRMRVSVERRQSLLAEYDQSGLSAKKFAQLAGIKYQTLANWLQMRQTRATRLTRLAPVQRLAQIVEDVRRWLGEVLADGHREAATEKVVEAVKQTEPVKQTEKIAPAVKETPGQKLRREIAQQQPQQRRSGGMRV